MEITQQQAYDEALLIIGRMTVEKSFYDKLINEQASKIKELEKTEDID